MMVRHALALAALIGLGMIRAVIPEKRPAFRILLFHDVPKARFPAFERLVAHVEETHGVLSPAEAEAWLAGRETGPGGGGTGRTPCLFSFDDGFASNFDVATGPLARHGIEALFFVCPGLVDLAAGERPAAIAATIFDGRAGAHERASGVDLMSWEQLAELARLGHTVGAHGMTHRRLSLLDGDVLEHEILAAGDIIEERLNRPVSWYAYSFGDIDSISRPALRTIGRRYRFCRSGVRGTNAAATHPMTLRAEQVDLEVPFAYQELVAAGGLAVRYGKARRRLDALADR